MNKAVLGMMMLTMVACGHNGSGGHAAVPTPIGQVETNQNASTASDLPNLSASEGRATYAYNCENPVRVEQRPSETAIEGGITQAGGTWEVESIRTFGGGVASEDNEQYAVVGEFRDGQLRVTCHNSTGDGASNYKNANSNFNVPFQLDASHRLIHSTLDLQLQSRGGKTAARFTISPDEKAMPAMANVSLPGLQSLLVCAADGKLILRFQMKQTTPDGVSILAAEVVFKRID